MIELCFLVGHYEMLAMTLNSLGVEPDPSALANLTGWPARVADDLRTRLAAQQRGRTDPSSADTPGPRPRASHLKRSLRTQP
jgi:hypothetical protein